MYITLQNSLKSKVQILFSQCIGIHFCYLRKIITIEAGFYSLYPEVFLIYDIEGDSWQAEELNRGRGLLSIMGMIFLIDYETFQNGSVIEFIPSDTDKSRFKLEDRIARNSNFTILNQVSDHMMFSKPVKFSFRNLKE